MSALLCQKAMPPPWVALQDGGQRRNKLVQPFASFPRMLSNPLLQANEHATARVNIRASLEYSTGSFYLNVEV